MEINVISGALYTQDGNTDQSERNSFRGGRSYR